MSRKNNLKFAKTRQKAALERDKERRAKEEARRARRHEMRVLDEAVARLTLSRDHSAAAVNLPSKARDEMSSFSSSNERAYDDEKAASPAVNGNSTEETTHVSAVTQEGPRSGGPQQQRRQDLRVRKSIAKGGTAAAAIAGRGGLGRQGKDKRKQTSSGKKKAMRDRVLVRGKNHGVKEVIRSRDKKILKQMKKRGKPGKQQQKQQQMWY